MANLFEITQGLFLNGGQAAKDIAFGGLAVREVIGFVSFDHIFLVGLPHFKPFLLDLWGDGPFARRDAHRR